MEKELGALIKKMDALFTEVRHINDKLNKLEKKLDSVNYGVVGAKNDVIREVRSTKSAINAVNSALDKII